MHMPSEPVWSWVETPIGEEVEKTIEFFEFVLDEHCMTVGIEGDAAATAPIDRSLFRRAVSNLLQNAIQHSPDAARIEVRIEPRGGAVQVAVGALLGSLLDRDWA